MPDRPLLWSIERLPNIQSALRLLGLLLAFTAYAAVARDTDTSPVPPLPKRDQVSLIGLQPTLFGADGSITWIAADYNRKTKVADGRCGVYPAVKRTWQPADGTTQETPLGIGADGIGAQLATPAGMLFATVNPGFNCMVLVQPNNGVVTATLTQRFVEPRLAQLRERRRRRTRRNHTPYPGRYRATARHSAQQ